MRKQKIEDKVQMAKHVRLVFRENVIQIGIHTEKGPRTAAAVNDDDWPILSFCRTHRNAGIQMK